MLIYYLPILFGEMSLHVLCQSSWIADILLLSFESF